MLRALAGLILATFCMIVPLASIVAADSAYFAEAMALLVIVSALTITLIFGVPALLIMKSKKWVAWWHSLIFGVLIPKPMALDMGSTVYTFLLITGFGIIWALIFWIIGIFRNPSFTSPNQKLPVSLVLVPLGAIPFIAYLQALESEWVYGCIVDYEIAENPTPKYHADVSVILDDGRHHQSGIQEIYSNPEIVGNCAIGRLEPRFNLADFDYKLVSIRSNNCVQICPNQ